MTALADPPVNGAEPAAIAESPLVRQVSAASSANADPASPTKPSIAAAPHIARRRNLLFAVIPLPLTDINVPPLILF